DWVRVYELGGGKPMLKPDSPSNPNPETGNLALDKIAVASSIEGGGLTAKFAFDGDTNTRWASQASDAQWVYVDLGASKDINRVVLNWEAAYGKGYQIQVSEDKTNWTTIFTTTTGDGTTDDISLTGKGQYIRLLGTARGTGYGYSLWDFEVYGSATNPNPVINKALNKPAVASSDEGAGMTASFATDGNSETRWASQWTDAQWIYVDLGSSQSISKVDLKWEAAYGKGYQIQVSEDKLNWTSISTVTNGNGDLDEISAAGTGRYVRVLGTTRGTGYGYSLWDFEVY
ncbi:MAG: discoidin domain-containing protein, partial [Moraxellaceae bacterium]